MKRILLACAAAVSLLTACLAPASPAWPPTAGPTPSPILTLSLISSPTPLPITPTFFATPTLEPTPPPTPAPEPIYLNLLFHFHQPVAGVDAATGLALRPTLRLRALRSYRPLVEMLRRHPDLRIAASFSPVLLAQLQELSAGARDLHWEMSARDAATLTEQDRRFVVAHFFDDTPASIIGSFPRYAELHGLQPGGAEQFSEQDVRDLQVWHNLAQFPPDELEQAPLHAIVAKGRGFNEVDKQAVLSRMTDIIQSLLPLYRQLLEQGAIDVLTTPYAHPVLPLLTSATSSAGAGSGAPPRFPYPQDGAEQLNRGAVVYQSAFGRAPEGYWPPEGALAPEDLPALAGAGFKWLVASEHNLAVRATNASAGRAGGDKTGSVRQLDALYRPRAVDAGNGRPLIAAFADTQLSGSVLDAAMDQPEAAARMLVDRLSSIRDEFNTSSAPGPHLATLVLDGEYIRQPFVSQLFAALSEAANNRQVETVRLADYATRFPASPAAGPVVAGAWSGRPLRSWLASPEAVKAWSYLTRTREFLDGYLGGDKLADPGAIKRAYNSALLAEGSDWIAAYAAGAEEGDDAGSREYVDQTYRSLLAQVYAELGAPPPDYIGVPIFKPAVARAERSIRGVISPTLDGMAEDGEWDSASLAQFTRAPGAAVERAFFGLNADTLFARIDASADWAALAASQEPVEAIRVGVYLKLPDVVGASGYTRTSADNDGRAPLNFDATHLIEWTLEPNGSASAMLYSAGPNQGWSPAAAVEASALGRILELAMPLNALDGLRLPATLNYVIAVASRGRTTTFSPPGGLAEVTVQ